MKGREKESERGEKGREEGGEGEGEREGEREGRERVGVGEKGREKEEGGEGRERIILLCFFAPHRLQFLPYSITTLTKLTAVWIAENQNRPLLDLQLTRSGDGQKMITCILLPQEPSESPFSSRQCEFDYTWYNVEPLNSGQPWDRNSPN